MHSEPRRAARIPAPGRDAADLVFIGEDHDVVRLARHFTDWLAEESCGQCPPCLQGTVSLGRTLDIILQGEGLTEHLHALWAKSHWRQLKTLITTKYTKSTKKP
jgi:NADH:ubiquinone oxidoreductase subunit F (NADH-binding)